MAYQINRLSLLSSEARIQSPWVKVTLCGDEKNYTFGIFSKKTRGTVKDDDGFYLRNTYSVQYPNYIQSLQVTKINGQVNQYVLKILYPIRPTDDPNFFEKIFSNVSKTRKIIFSYGDATVPTYVYKDEEAVITTIQQSFNLESSSISYTVNAISGAALHTLGCVSFNARNNTKPSTVIKEVFNQFGLNKVFTGMSNKNWSELVAGDDKAVDILAKTNVSVIDYIGYLVSCMYSSTCGDTQNPKEIYIFTIHDNSTYDNLYDNGNTLNGPYFKVTKVDYQIERSDAYEIDVGYNTSTIVTQFSIENNENYSLYYDYQKEINDHDYVRRLNDNGQWEDVFAPTVLSKNINYAPRAEDKTWWTKITQFPVNANITIQGLLRPAQLLTYVRLNIIFPGGTGSDNTRMHTASGLYIITKQVDTIDQNGYKTALSMTKVGGALLKKESTNNTKAASVINKPGANKANNKMLKIK